MLKSKTVLGPILSGLVVFLCQAVNVASAEMDASLAFGKTEYDNNCTVCHGRGGTGGGPMSDLFKVQPPGLSMISKRNGGVFPVLKVYQIIDGRRGLRGHGNDQMPIWGNRYRVNAEQHLSSTNVPHDVNPEFIVHGRILSLVYYLESIQTK